MHAADRSGDSTNTRRGELRQPPLHAHARIDRERRAIVPDGTGAITRPVR
jgi:hypothetical protein